MFVLPTTVWDLLDQLQVLGEAHFGRTIRRHDLVAALIMREAPTTPRGLQELVWEYVGTRQFGITPLLLPRHQYMLRLPSPVTHRLDELVARARESDGERVLRRDMVAALIAQRAPRTGEAVNRLYEDYIGMQAADAALPGQPASRVLSRKKPSPGVRAFHRTRTTT